MRTGSGTGPPQEKGLQGLQLALRRARPGPGPHRLELDAHHRLGRESALGCTGCMAECRALKLVLKFHGSKLRVKGLKRLEGEFALGLIVHFLFVRLP